MINDIHIILWWISKKYNKKYKFKNYRLLAIKNQTNKQSIYINRKLIQSKPIIILVHTKKLEIFNELFQTNQSQLKSNISTKYLPTVGIIVQVPPYGQLFAIIINDSI